MIVIDTNVFSEVFRPEPNQGVLEWFNRTSREDLVTTTVTLAELRGGAAVRPQGRRRAELTELIDQVVDKAFRDRIWAFDPAAAQAYGAVLESRKRAGSPIQTADAFIAAICRSRDAMIATRDIKGFEKTGVTIVNPWED